METIEGIPDWLSVVAYRPPKRGEYYLDNKSAVVKCTSIDSVWNCLVVRPNNIYDSHDLNTITLPDGYEWTGEYRPVEAKELYLNLTFQPATTIVKTQLVHDSKEKETKVYRCKVACY